MKCLDDVGVEGEILESHILVDTTLAMKLLL